MKKFKVKAKKDFPDRYAGKKRKTGEVFEVNNARLLEIRRSGDYVEVVEAVKETAPEKEAAAPTKAPEAKEKK